jgi:hypothetical protein
MKHMKKLLNGIAGLAVLSLAMMMTGCGDGDADSGSSNNPPPPAPGSVAQPTGKTYTVNTPNGQRTLAFTSATAYTLTSATAGGDTEAGTFNFTSSTRTNAHVVLTAANGSTSTVDLAYDSVNATGGNYTSVFTPAGGAAEPMETGTFSVANTPVVIPDPGNGGGGGNGGNTNAVPTSLVGQHLQLSGTGGGEFIDFMTATAFTGEISNGTYTWTPGTTQGTLHADLTTANDGSSHAGEFYDLVFTFTSPTAGTFTGNQFYENQAHAANGTFTLTPR